MLVRGGARSHRAKKEKKLKEKYSIREGRNRASVHNVASKDTD